MSGDSDEDVLSRQYPGRDDGIDGAMDTDSDGDGCACPCRTGDPPGRPSIYTGLYEDRRAELERRDYAKILATIGGLTALGSLAAPVASLTQVFERGYAGPVYSDGVALVDADGRRVGENTLSFGEVTTVFPEPRPGIDDAPTLLVRFREEEYGERPSNGSASDGVACRVHPDLPTGRVTRAIVILGTSV